VTLLALVLLLPLACLVLPTSVYLLTLTVAAPFGLRRRPPAPEHLTRFAVLVPAHDEESTIGRLLQSVNALDYPRDRVDIYVVADNCGDATAARARERGATVFERHDTDHRGKGYALDWLLDQVRRTGHPVDAYLLLDADTVVSPNLLRVMNAHLAAGARVVQAYYTVLPVRGTRAERMRQAALALVHYLRPAAKTALRASCGLKGNGMCFQAAVLDRFGWATTGLAEDVEFHLQLVAAGIPVTFAPEAVVSAEMPPSLGGSRGQNLRWEAGRVATVRRQALPLLLRGLRERRIAAVDAAIEQLVPPLSVPFAVATLCLVAGLLTHLPLVWVAASALLASLVLYVVAGLLLANVPFRVYLALFQAPVYIAWKASLYMRAVANRGDRRWVRTERLSGP
jgi:cellulose synthase/poly-beta-1,6-N-acetylglucosamine synthase-like glycosyltransferase